MLVSGLNLRNNNHGRSAVIILFRLLISPDLVEKLYYFVGILFWYSSVDGWLLLRDTMSMSVSMSVYSDSDLRRSLRFRHHFFVFGKYSNLALCPPN
jgi:hypothetical protein